MQMVWISNSKGPEAEFIYPSCGWMEVCTGINVSAESVLTPWQTSVYSNKSFLSHTQQLGPNDITNSNWGFLQGFLAPWLGLNNINA